MELKIKSKKFKAKYLYGDLVEHKKATSLVVFLSGFSGSRELPLFEHVSVEFVKNGFSTLRLNFCGDEDDKRKYPNVLELSEMSFSVYITELKNVLDLVGKKYSGIVLVGHSFGAPISIIFLDKYRKYASKTQLVIWDPTLLPWKKEWMEEDYVFDKDKRLYVSKHNNIEAINKVFYKECICIKSTTEVLRSLKREVCIIAAEKGAHKDAKKYFLKLRNKKSSILWVIKNANHLFDGKRVQKELFEKTLEFLKDLKVLHPTLERGSSI